MKNKKENKTKKTRVLIVVDPFLDAGGKAFEDRYSIKILFKSTIKFLDLNKKELEKFINRLNIKNYNFELCINQDLIEELFING